MVTDDGAVELPRTASALIPASAGSFTVEGTCRVLVSRVVDGRDGQRDGE